MWFWSTYTLKTVSSASIYLSVFLSTQNNLNWVHSVLCVLHYGFYNPLNLRLTSSWIPQTSISFLLFLKPLVGPWVCSKPRQDDPLLGLSRKRNSIGGNRPRRAPAVPGLAEHWWVLTGQLPRQRALKWCLGTSTRLWDSLSLPIMELIENRLLFWSLLRYTLGEFN